MINASDMAIFDGIMKITLYGYLIERTEPFKSIYEKVKNGLLVEYGGHWRRRKLWYEISRKELFAFIENNETAWIPWKHNIKYDPEDINHEICRELGFIPIENEILLIWVMRFCAIKKFMREDFSEKVSDEELGGLIAKYEEALKDASDRFVTWVYINIFLKKRVIPEYDPNKDTTSPEAHVQALDFLLQMARGDLTKRETIEILNGMVLEENYLRKHGLGKHEIKMANKLIQEALHKQVKETEEKAAEMLGEKDYDPLRLEKHRGGAYEIVLKALRRYKERISGASVISNLWETVRQELKHYYKSEMGFPEDWEFRYPCGHCGWDCSKIAEAQSKERKKGIICPQCGNKMNIDFLREGISFFYDDNLEDDDDHPDFWDQYSDGNIIPKDIERVVDKLSLEKILKSAATLSDKQRKVIESDLNDPDSGDKERARRLNLSSAGAVRSLRTDAHKELKKGKEEK